MRVMQSARRQVLVLFAVLLLGYFYSGVQRISAGVILPNLGRSLGFSAALTGFLGGLFFFSYGFMQNVWGAISDRIGPLTSCAVGMMAAAIGSALFILSADPIFIGLSRLLCGLGLAAFFTGINIYAAIAFPQDEYPFWVGFVQIIGNLGTVAAVAPLGLLLDAFGYRGVYILLTATALLISGTLWVNRNASIRLVPLERPQPALGLREIIKLTWLDVCKGYRFIMEVPSLAVIVYAWSAASAAVMSLQGLWGVSWLMASSGATESSARFWTTIISLGLVIGASCGSQVAARSPNRRVGLMLILYPLSALWVVYLFFSWLRLPAPVTGSVGFLVGVLSSTCMVFSIASVKAIAPLAHAGLAIGTGQMLLYVAVIIVQWGSGLIINLFPAAESGTYLNEGFLLAFGIMALFVVVSALLASRMAPERAPEVLSGN